MLRPPCAFLKNSIAASENARCDIYVFGQAMIPGQAGGDAFSASLESWRSKDNDDVRIGVAAAGESDGRRNVSSDDLHL
jgi:hypothetical protein